MSDTLQEVDTSDDEITMYDPFDSEEAKDVSSDDDIKIVPRKKDEKSIDEPENLVEATLSESEEVVLMDPFEEQASPKEEDRVKVSNSNEEEIEEEEEITLVELDTSPVERKEGEILLAPRSKDNDQGAMRRKRQRAKKVRDKWNQLVFVPMPVLNNRDLTSGGKAGKREGFNTFNRLSCKPCGKCFRKASGLWCHPCSSSAGRQSAQRPSFKSSIPRSSSSSPRPTFPKSRSPLVGSRRSSRVTKVENGYREDDEIEIVGDTEMDKKNAEKVDKNFSKMTLKGQREAMEAFKSSTLYSTEEEEEEEEEESRGHKKAGPKKRKVMVESDSDSDIEVLESPKPKKSETTSAGEGKVLEKERETKKTDHFDEKLLKDECDKKKPEFVQVKSASGKTMLVERSKLQKLMSMERSKVAKMATIGKEEVVQTGSKYTFKPIEKKSPVPEEILLDDDDDSDQKEKTDDNLKKSRDPVGKSAIEDKPEAKRKNAEADVDAEEILLADDEDGEVTIDNEVAMDDHSTFDDRIQQLKRKHEWQDVESKRMRKTIQG